MSSTAVGRKGEGAAADYLIKDGYTILARNYRIRGGEIDLVARKGDDIVFVEVKTRSNARYGFPEECVTTEKARHIARTIAVFVWRHQIPDTFYLRFDIIAVDSGASGGTHSLRHIPNVELPTRF